MARVDHPAHRASLPAARDPELPSRFVEEALACVDQLQDRTRRLIRNTVDAEELVHEAMGQRRAQHRPYGYLGNHVTRVRRAVGLRVPGSATSSSIQQGVS